MYILCVTIFLNHIGVFISYKPESKNIYVVSNVEYMDVMFIGSVIIVLPK